MQYVAVYIQILHSCPSLWSTCHVVETTPYIQDYATKYNSKKWKKPKTWGNNTEWISIFTHKHTQTHTNNQFELYYLY